jgi:protocatechuate 3,4-dioxygenase beta subunit
MNQQDLNTQPPYLYAAYKSTVLRSPTKPLLIVKENLKNINLPVLENLQLVGTIMILTKNARKNGEPIGERIKVSGKVMDEYGLAVACCTDWILAG